MVRESQKRAQKRYNATHRKRVRHIALKSECKRFILQYADDEEIKLVKSWIRQKENED